jgi:4-carboxymuconolactone decarboxylase
MNSDNETESQSNDALARGLAVRRRLYGEARTGEPRRLDAVAPDFGTISDEVIFGRIWAREGLPLETRILVVISALIARGLFDYVRIQMYAAKRLGISQDTLSELCLQLFPYAGVPMAHSALRVLAEVYADDAAAEAPSW